MLFKYFYGPPVDGDRLTALELGKYGITVNAYAPSGIDTPMCKVQEVLISQLTPR